MSPQTSTPSVQPYLYFNGACEAALEFYRKAIGAAIDMQVRFKEAPDSSMIAPGTEEKIMHATFRIGSSILMASDGKCGQSAPSQGFALSLAVKDPAAAEQAFNALGEGGRVIMPLGKTFYSPCFGMVADRFGITWMVIVPTPNP